MEKRNCPFCGKPVGSALQRCPYCREAIPAVRAGRRVGGAGSPGDARANIRRGLLWTLLAGVIYYFAGGHSGLKLPMEIPGFVNQYLTPILFLGGAGLALYGLFQRFRS